MTPDGTPPEGKPPAPKPPPPKPAAPGKPDLSLPVPNAALDALSEAMGDAVEEVTWFAGGVSVRVAPERLIEVLSFLRDDPRSRMNLLSDLCGAHFPADEKGFEVMYHLYSIPNNLRIRVKVRVDEQTPVATVIPLWATANWHEREVFDLFGVRFEGHPDLTRILLPDDWKGHPLRKEYPLEGFTEQHPRFR